MLLKEIEEVNYSKIIEEIPKTIFEQKFEQKDIPYVIKITSELKQTYEKFGDCYKDYLIREVRNTMEINKDNKSQSNVSNKDIKSNNQSNQDKNKKQVSNVSKSNPTNNKTAVNSEKKESKIPNNTDNNQNPQDSTTNENEENKDYLFPIFSNKQEEEEEKKVNRKKVMIKLLIDSFLAGIIKEFSPIRECFVKILTINKEEFNSCFPILVFLLKSYSELLFGIRPNKVQELIDNKIIEDYNLSDTQDFLNDAGKYTKSFQDYFNKVVLIFLSDRNKALLEIEKKQLDSLSKIDSNNELQDRYMKQRAFYIKFLNQVSQMADLINSELPDFANDKFMRVEETQNVSYKIERINKYDPFADEDEYSFYKKPLVISEVNPELHEKSISGSIQCNLDDDTLWKQFETFSLSISKCDSKKNCDEIIIDFLTNLNFSKVRKSLTKVFLRGSSKTNFSILKYYARFIKTVSFYQKEIKEEVNDFLMKDFLQGFSSDKLNNMDERIKNIKFVCEMVKFDNFPIQMTLQMLSKLYDEFDTVSIQLLCLILEGCGRYLFVNEQSHLKIDKFLNDLKKASNYKIYYDSRIYNTVLNTIQICKPNEHLLKHKVKVRSIDEEFIRYLIYNVLNKENIKKVAILLRRMNWNNSENEKIEREKEDKVKDNAKLENNTNENEQENDENQVNDIIVKPEKISHEKLILKYIYRLLLNGKEQQVILCCVLLLHLKDSHEHLISKIVQLLIEELRLCLERRSFNDNQHKMLICSVLGRMYSYKLINTDLSFFILYFIIVYSPDWNIGITELRSDNPWDGDTDFSRILMVINFLEISGEYLKKEKLNEFVHFLQVYILTKKYLPSDIENRILNVLETIIGKTLQIFNDFEDALSESKKYKGLCFEDEDQIKNENSNTHGFTAKKKIVIDDSDEYERKEEKKVVEEKYDIDTELNKIVAEELNKAKKTNVTYKISINDDLKKNKIKDKELEDNEQEEKDANSKGGRNFKLIAKVNGKPQIKKLIVKND